jgi:predicted DNA-binding WGR domain protein
MIGAKARGVAFRAGLRKFPCPLVQALENPVRKGLTGRHPRNFAERPKAAPVQIRLEKVNHIRRQRSYCVITMGQTLFGEWFVRREWGRIGTHGKYSVMYLGTCQEALETSEALKLAVCRKGYAPIPVQLPLF